MDILKNKSLAFVLLIGVLSSVGHFVGADALTLLGRSTVASPEAIVFTAHEGIETYGLSYQFHFNFADSSAQSVELDQRTYQQLKGPFMRRNVYGGALSYAPLLKAPEQREVLLGIFRYGFCKPGVLSREFSLAQSVKAGRIEVFAKHIPAATLRFVCQQ